MIDAIDLLVTIIIDGETVVAFRVDRYKHRLIKWLQEYKLKQNQKLIIIDTWYVKARIFSTSTDWLNQVKDWLN